MSGRRTGRSRSGGTGPGARTGAVAPALPSRGARVAGAVIALITVALAVALLAGAAGKPAPDAVARIVAGALLLALALGIGALAAFPAAVRDRLTRR